MTVHPFRPRRWRQRVGLSVVGAIGVFVFGGLSTLSALGVLGGTQASGAPAASQPSSQLRITWTTAPTASGPPPLKYATAVYDSDTRTVVMFGGVESNGALSNDTWVWNGSEWTDFPGTQVQAPPARLMTSMAFNPEDHQLILFGGQGVGGQLLGDTWAWNGASWYELTFPQARLVPGPREAAAFSYDGHHHLVLFGGTGQSKAFGSVGSPTTAAASTTTTQPSITSPPTVLGDTWLWTANGWVLSPGSGPSARSGASMTLDTTNGPLVLFGGESTRADSASPRLLRDTWSWRGSSWAPTNPSTTPPARDAASLGASPVLGGLALFGGAGSSGALDDTWIWTGATWTVAHPQGNAAPRAGAASAYDVAAHQFVVFGGVAPGGEVLGDTLTMSAVRESTGNSTLKTSPTTPSSVTPKSSPPSKSSSSTTRPVQSTRPKPRSGVGVGPGIGQVTARLNTDANVVRRGENVVVSGSGFSAEAPITIWFHSTTELIGFATADVHGRFSATVTVPLQAKGGNHHFEARGITPKGQSATLLAPVVVVGVPSSVASVRTAVMVGLAVLVPVGSWFVMGGVERLRRRRRLSVGAAGPAANPSSTSARNRTPRPT